MNTRLYIFVNIKHLLNANRWRDTLVFGKEHTEKTR